MVDNSFGFIVSNFHEGDIFFHFQNVNLSSFKIEVGDEVSFLVVDTKRSGRPQAVDVRILNKSRKDAPTSPKSSALSVENGKQKRLEDRRKAEKMRQEQRRQIQRKQTGFTKIKNADVTKEKTQKRTQHSKEGEFQKAKRTVSANSEAPIKVADNNPRRQSEDNMFAAFLDDSDESETDRETQETHSGLESDSSSFSDIEESDRMRRFSRII